jgi:hydrogenase maturation protease
MTRRIICIGNRYAAEDAAGPAVYDHLRRLQMPAGLELIDGGLAGLDLLRHLEGAEQVVFVDSVSGFGDPNKVLILTGDEVAALASSRYDHSAGLAYLLRVLPEVCEGALPQVRLVGIEGLPDQAAIGVAATLALKIAGGSAHENRP